LKSYNWGRKIKHFWQDLYQRKLWEAKMKRNVSWLACYLKSPNSKSVVVITDSEKVHQGWFWEWSTELVDWWGVSVCLLFPKDNRIGTCGRLYSKFLKSSKATKGKFVLKQSKQLCFWYE
jgi:hypothetical protein